MNYKFRESYNLGNEEMEVEVKYFEKRKEAREYLNCRVKEVKEENKEWKTYYQENTEYFSEKELRKASHIELEDQGLFDIGNCNIYYLFEIEMMEV